jgi:hypothetical protein
MEKTEGIAFETVRREELEALGNPHDAELLGLALSGGGIRSATFNLGVLQALARLGLLKKFHYLSTVSGGGFIGSWLSAWVARCKGGIAEVEEWLAERREGHVGREPREVRFLREFSNYLTPKLGWSSVDSLTGVATYLRNLLLNLSIIVAAAGALLLVPWLLALLGNTAAPEALLLGSVGLLAVAAAGITRNVIWQEIEESRAESGPAAGGDKPPAAPGYVRPRAIARWVVLPLVLWAFALSLALKRMPELLGEATVGVFIVVGFATLFIVRALCRLAARRMHPALSRWDPLRRTVALAIGTAAGVGLLTVFAKILARTPTWHAVVWGVPGALVIFLLAVTVILGVSGRKESEYAREWWSRLGGLLIRLALAWFAVCAAAAYGPWLVWRLGEAASGLGIAWIVTTGAAVLLGKSPATGGGSSRKALELLTRIGPYVFIAGLLIAVSTLLYLALAHFSGLGAGACTAATFGEGCPGAAYFHNLDVLAASWRPAAALAALFLFALGMSWAVDINLFSFHMFYRNRLTRCYLGASNKERRPLPFIEFDPNDNPQLAKLEARPYHLVNTALNLTSSRRLGWQERKAGAFVLSKLFCGYWFPDMGPSGMPSDPCYQRTLDYAADAGGYLNLGTAMTISGAAASPNMGYHSSPAVAFLLTVFNVRLGWWLQNPSSPRTWRNGGPYLGLRYMLSELLGISNELTPFVSVSDGGHFDNLGIYELVRRRCRFIVVSDASADGKFEFEDLGNAIRKCHIDFDVDIEIRKRAIAPDPADRRSRYHCAVGTIHYEKRYPGMAPGYLLYMKASLSGNEPSDVLQYAAASPDFPHESTQDQWFSESQFESYRKLGGHIAQVVFEGARVTSDLDPESAFVALKERWFPPASSGSGAFSRHGEQLKALQNTLRTDPNLKFLEQQLYPEWFALTKGAPPPPARNPWLPPSYDELRAGFHFCSNMLQLMENAYLEFNLEEEYEHPDHRGWMNLFRHWSWSGMFIATYAVGCSMYGARFQRFCERRLDLRSGRLHVPPAKDLAAARGDLNFVELETIDRLKAAGLEFDGVYLLQTLAWSPAELKRDQPGAPGSFVYTFGFALSRGKTLVYFRIQDHLRQMGHARRALSRLYYGYHLDKLDVSKKTGPDLPKMEWLEAQDFPALERLFESVKLQAGDHEEAQKKILMRERAGKGALPPRA